MRWETNVNEVGDECHVNIDVVTHLKVTKYCYKYVFKRPDEATICIDEIEIIQHHLDAHLI